MQVVVESIVSKMETEEEMAAVFKRFGDEQSTLLDKYERLSFEVQLNQAIMGRSLSEPAGVRRKAPSLPAKVVLLKASGKQGTRPSPSPSGNRGYGFQKAVKKLLSPIIGRKLRGNEAGAAAVPNAKKDPTIFWKAFGRSLRV